jgi:hypothetical protein
MNKDAMIAQFSNLTPSDQAMMLLRVCFNLTIVTRDIFASDSQNKAEFARNMSEMYHKIFPGIIYRLRQIGSSYPDDVLIGMLYGFFVQFDLESQADFIWDGALRKLSE